MHPLAPTRGAVLGSDHLFDPCRCGDSGIIENMSYYVCPHCGEHDDIFSHGGGKQEAARLEVPFLGEIPLFTEIRICGDKGLPIVVAEPKSAPAKAFMRCAETVSELLAKG